MAHAFRSAAVIEAENAQRKLDRLRDRWTATRSTWYDGTPDSVAGRIANLDEVISFAKHVGSRLHMSGVGATALSLLPQLRADRTQLVALQQHLAGDGWQAEHGVGFPHGEGWNPSLGDHFDMDLGDQRADWGGPQGHGRSFAIPGGEDGFMTRPDEAAMVHRDPTGRDRILDHRGEERFSNLREAALDFIEGENTTDRQELLIRAQRLVADRTSSWGADAAQKATRDFLGAVNHYASRPVRTAAAPQVLQDFDDVNLFV